MLNVIVFPSAVPHDAPGPARREGPTGAWTHGELPAAPPQPGDARAAQPRLPRYPHEAKGNTDYYVGRFYFTYLKINLPISTSNVQIYQVNVGSQSEYHGT